MITDNFYIPQKTTMPVPKNQTNVEAAARQALEEALRQAVPTIQYNNGNVYVYLTINIHS